jgi:hypothetical protein
LRVDWTKRMFFIQNLGAGTRFAFNAGLSIVDPIMI